MAEQLGRLTEESANGEGGVGRARPARSVTVNVAESPLGWLKSRGHISNRQFDACQQLGIDWVRAQPSVTMRRSRAGGAEVRTGIRWKKMKAKERF